jgi:hypothetical protein
MTVHVWGRCVAVVDLRVGGALLKNVGLTHHGAKDCRLQGSSIKFNAQLETAVVTSILQLVGE